MNKQYIEIWVKEMKKKRKKVADGKKTLRELIKKDAEAQIFKNAVIEMFKN